MTLHQRIALVAVTVVAAGGGGIFVAASSSASTAAAVPTSFTVTVAGTDMHSLDARVTPQAVANSGGGVTPSYESSEQPPNGPITFEAAINLPKGARVTAVSFTLTPGDRTGCLGEPLMFGSYVPQDAMTTTNVSFDTPYYAGPCHRATYTKTGNPIATVVNGRRYVVQWRPQPTSPYPGSGEFSGIFHGATVQYTCTSPCVP
ncbi:MAG TPA: hypothetical protein VGO03_13750 [Acidimicrobiia bacterium]|jgi:hypothetical protein